MTTKRNHRLLTLRKVDAVNVAKNEATPQPSWLFSTKTAAVNFVIGLGSMIPPVADWEASHAKTTVLILVGLNLALRALTHGRTYLYGSDD